MKTIIYALTFLFSTLIFAQENKGVTITIEIENLSSNEGKISASLYNEATFMKAAPLESIEGTPENKSITLTIENIQPGNYGIITLQDFNDNGRMDFEPNGMPKEPYGVSGIGAGFGPPLWGDAKFTVDGENMTIKIAM